MTRFRKASGHRRSVQHTRGDARRQRDDRARRAEQADGCRFPGQCTCPQCAPDDNDEEGQ